MTKRWIQTMSLAWTIWTATYRLGATIQNSRFGVFEFCACVLISTRRRKSHVADHPNLIIIFLFHGTLFCCSLCFNFLHSFVSLQEFGHKVKVSFLGECPQTTDTISHTTSFSVQKWFSFERMIQCRDRNWAQNGSFKTSQHRKWKSLKWHTEQDLSQPIFCKIMFDWSSVTPEMKHIKQNVLQQKVYTVAIHSILDHRGHPGSIFLCCNPLNQQRQASPESGGKLSPDHWGIRFIHIKLGINQCK